MLDISLKSDLKLLERELRDWPDQIDFAKVVAINEVAFKAKRAVDRQIERKLHEPTRFTKGAVGVKKAKKRDQVAQVYIRGVRGAPRQGASRDYLVKQVEGGRRTARRGGRFPVPVSEDLKNRYGNIPRKKIQRLLGRSTTSGHGSVFSGKPKGHPGAPDGVWMRIGGAKKGRRRVGTATARLELLAVWRTVAGPYRPGRLPMEKTVRGVVSSQLPKAIEKGVRVALRSRRRR